MERELQEHVDALARTPAGMDQPLVDAEGYPRDDCDLMAVRTHRNRAVCLRNDLKQVMLDAEAALHKVHELAREQGDRGGGPFLNAPLPTVSRWGTAQGRLRLAGLPCTDERNAER
eukprot:gene25052-56948_t